MLIDFNAYVLKKTLQPHYTTLCVCVYLLIYDETIVTFIKLIISDFIKGVLTTTRRELRKPQVKEIVSLSLTLPTLECVA